MAYHLEKLSADIIDEDFANIFKPIHLLKAIVGNLNVKIEHGFVTPPSKWYNLYATFILTTDMLSQLFLTTECECTEYLFIDDVYYKSFNIFVHVCDYVLFLYQRLIVDNESLCDFYVKLQRIDRDLKTKEYNNNVVWALSFVASVAIAVLFVCFTVVQNTFLMKGFCPFAVFVGFSNLITVIDITLCLLILYYIHVRLDYIKKELEKIKRFVESKSELHTMRRPTDQIKDESIEVGVETKLTSLVQGTHDVLTVLADFTDLFQMKILYFTFIVLVWVLMVIELAIILLKYQAVFSYMMITNSETYFVLIQLSFDYSLVYFLLCIFTELITSKLEKSRKLCIDIVHSSEGAIKRNAKRMLLLLDVKNDISLYGIYTLNARLLVRTLGVVATYTIIILQFCV